MLRFKKLADKAAIERMVPALSDWFIDATDRLLAEIGVRAADWSAWEAFAFAVWGIHCGLVTDARNTAKILAELDSALSSSADGYVRDRLARVPDLDPVRGREAHATIMALLGERTRDYDQAFRNQGPRAAAADGREPSAWAREETIDRLIGFLLFADGDRKKCDAQAFLALFEQLMEVVMAELSIDVRPDSMAAS